MRYVDVALLYAIVESLEMLFSHLGRFGEENSDIIRT